VEKISILGLKEELRKFTGKLGEVYRKIKGH